MREFFKSFMATSRDSQHAADLADGDLYTDAGQKADQNGTG